MRTGEVADRLGLESGTIRMWTGREYKQFMSETAKGTKSGRRRTFTDRDVRILTAVVQMRNEGLAHEEIQNALTDMQANDWHGLPDIPPKPEHENDVPMMPRETAQVALSKQADVLNQQIVALERQVRTLESMFENEQDSHEETRQQLLESREELGSLRGKLEALEGSTGRERRLLLIVAGAVAIVAALLLLTVLWLAVAG